MTTRKYVTQNGYTKAKMIEMIQSKMLDHPSTLRSGQCAYQAEDGNRCAVGVFIPDRGFKGALSLLGVVSKLLDSYPSLEQHMPLDRVAIRCMQQVHDAYTNVDYSDRRPALINWINENVVDAEPPAA
jgi:hypothetical protein